MTGVQTCALPISGDPIDADNKPKDDFERSAVKAMLAGQSGYEQVVEKEGKRYLRSATPVPVVMDKCIMCHANYKGKTIIGALGYTVPVE